MGLVGAGLLILAPGRRCARDARLGWPSALLTLVVWMITPRRAGSCEVALAAGCCIRSSAFWPWRRSEVPSRRCENRWIVERSRREAGSLTLAATASTSIAAVRVALRCPGSRAGRKLFRLEDDRAGYGPPDKGLQLRPCRQRPERGRDGSQKQHPDSHRSPTLLEPAGEPGPYVLVGHSLGGAYALGFAEQFPAQVAGVVLVDSMIPGTVHERGRLRRLLRRLASSVRAASVTGPTWCRPHRRLQRTRGRRLPRRRRRDPERLAARPSAGKHREQAADRHHRRQRAAGRLDIRSGRPRPHSTSSVHRLVTDATHASLLDDRADAAETSRAIGDVVRSVRGPLSRCETWRGPRPDVHAVR